MPKSTTLPKRPRTSTAPRASATDGDAQTRIALAHAPIGAYIVQDNRIQFANARLQQDLGYNEQELVGISPLDLVPPEEWQRVDESRTRMLDGSSTAHEYQAVAKGGDIHWVAESVSRIEYGGSSAILVYVTDVTERRSLEQSAREGEERYRAVIDNVGDALAVNIGEDRVYVNKMFLDIHGLKDTSEVVGRPVDAFIVADDGAMVMERNLARQRGESVPSRYEYRIRRADGQVRTLQTTATQTTFEGQTATLAIIRDVTESRRIEGVLVRKAEELARSNGELEQFGYVASHDLQEPLRKIQAFGDRLKSKESANLSERGLDYLERMQSAAGRMQVLISDLLSYSRVHTQVHPYIPVDLSEIVRDVLSDCEVRIEQTGARMEVGPLPIIDADPLQMRQLFQNLVTNALKFSADAGPPVVSISSQTVPVAPDKADGDLLPTFEIAVRDNGIGFDEQYLDRIFGIFQRLHGRTAYEGTGVGLAICRKIAERHGGDITARSADGQGATFIVTLPANQATGGIIQ